MIKVVSSIFVVFLLNACSTYTFPGVHRITVQQGNVITQVMIDKIKPGMTKAQVRYVLGNTVISDPLNQNRWDYIYTIQIPGTDTIQKKLQIFFVDGRLSHFEGDYVPTENMAGNEKKVKDTSDVTTPKASIPTLDDGAMESGIEARPQRKRRSSR